VIESFIEFEKATIIVANSDDGQLEISAEACFVQTTSRADHGRSVVTLLFLVMPSSPNAARIVSAT
jgi:hypothetical protein